jgi:hypothetical protein
MVRHNNPDAFAANVNEEVPFTALYQSYGVVQWQFPLSVSETTHMRYPFMRVVSIRLVNAANLSRLSCHKLFSE